MTVTGRWTCSIGHPDGWVVLPVDAETDPQRWAAGQARTMLGPDPDAVLLDTLTAELVAWTRDSREREPTMALAFYPDPTGPLVALCEIQDYRPDEVVGELTLDWLAATFGATADTVGQVESASGELPAGPAVRIRQVTEGSQDADGRRVVLETVTYAVRPPGIDVAVVLLFSWAALTLSQELAEMADAMAETLMIEMHS